METSKKNFRVIPEKQTCLRRLVLRSHMDPVFDCHENILLMGCSVGFRVLCCIARAIGTSSAADHELQKPLGSSLYSSTIPTKGCYLLCVESVDQL